MQTFDDREEVRRSALCGALATILWKARRVSSAKNEGVLVIIPDEPRWMYTRPKTMEDTIGIMKLHYDRILDGGVTPFTCSVGFLDDLTQASQRSDRHPLALP